MDEAKENLNHKELKPPRAARRRRSSAARKKVFSGLLLEHEAQPLNYLRATPYEVGLLLNFVPKPQFVRKAFDNSRKTPTWIE